MNTKQLVFIVASASLIGGSLPSYAGSRPQHDQGRYDIDHVGRSQVSLEKSSDHKFKHYVDERQRRQSLRIDQGLEAGELTREETTRLYRQQRKIDRLEHEFSSDGIFTVQERRRLREKLDFASDAIYRKKHNEVKRPQRYAVEDWNPRRSFARDFGRHDRMGYAWEDGRTRLLRW